MLAEIYCEAFGEEKRIPFAMGLNVIQGIGGNSSGNSIGKSSILKIIDFTFGGEYYAESNGDIIKHVGAHDICFAHKFNGHLSYFRRNAKQHKKVQCCDATYLPQKEISLGEFCEWLLSQYGFENKNFSFRQMVSLYARVWNRPNKEVERPLYNHNAQTIESAIITLVKLFNMYGPISELDTEATYLKKREKALNTAVSYNFLELPSSKKDYAKLISELNEIDNEIMQLKQNISIADIEGAANLSEEINDAMELRKDLLARQGRILREIKKTERNIKDAQILGSNDFFQLKDYFPNLNVEKIQEVQHFHESIRQILKSEFEQERVKLQQTLNEVQLRIKENEDNIQSITGLPTRTEDAVNVVVQLARRREMLQNKVNLYNDKITDAKHKKEYKEQLVQLLAGITSNIENDINAKIQECSLKIETSNSKAPVLRLTPDNYSYGVRDNTGTGKAYTDLILFDLAILALTDLPILIHDSFLFNNIDKKTIQSFIKLYGQFTSKQIFIALDEFLGDDSDEINKLLLGTTRLFLSENKMLYGIDWRK